MFTGEGCGHVRHVGEGVDGVREVGGGRRHGGHHESVVRVVHEARAQHLREARGAEGGPGLQRVRSEAILKRIQNEPYESVTSSNIDLQI
jgi:hypothetical protein